MIATLFLFILGMAMGAGMGAAPGALAGAVLGLLVGGAVHLVGSMRARVGTAAPVMGMHSVMCFPYGQAADVDLVGDPRKRRWVDVARCSLVHQRDGVVCDKGCLRLMNLTKARPGDDCSCEG